MVDDKVVSWNPLEKLNPANWETVQRLTEGLENLNNRIDTYMYWINPINWVKEGWTWLDVNISAGALDVPFMAASIVLIWLIVFGAKWPKKYLFWGWLAFWTLRGFIFI